MRAAAKTTVLVNRIANLVEFGNAYWEEDVPYITEEDMDFLERVADGSEEDDPPAGADRLPPS